MRRSATIGIVGLVLFIAVAVFVFMGLRRTARNVGGELGKAIEITDVCVQCTPLSQSCQISDLSNGKPVCPKGYTMYKAKDCNDPIVNKNCPALASM